MSKKDQDNTEEPLSDYGEPVSFHQVWKMFQETDKMIKETNKLLTEKSQETEKKMQETDSKIDKLAKLYSYDLAEKYGLLVLTQSGENITVMNPEGFELKRFSEEIG